MSNVKNRRNKKNNTEYAIMNSKKGGGNYTYICVCSRAQSHVCVCAHVLSHMCVCARVLSHMCVCSRAQSHVCVRSRAHMCVRACSVTCMCVCSRAQSHVCVCARVLSHMYVCVFACSVTYICVCSCAQSHIYVCAHMLSCVWLCDSMDCSPSGSSVRGIFQARILKRVAISSSRGSSWPRDQTCDTFISCISKQILYHRATWEALHIYADALKTTHLLHK